MLKGSSQAHTGPSSALTMASPTQPKTQSSERGHLGVAAAAGDRLGHDPQPGREADQPQQPSARAATACAPGPVPALVRADRR